MSKKLGQHFLQSAEKLNVIARSLCIEKNDNLIEIGPGHGELTKILLNAGANVVAVEKDDILAKKLQKTFSSRIENGKLSIINGDILDKLNEIVKENFLSTKYKIVGNIPYYITGYLMRLIGDMKNKPTKSVFLIQKEVGEKICSKENKTSLLSASVGFWADSKIIENVDRKYFLPPPKVDSVIIAIDTNTEKYNSKIKAEEYYRFMKILFKYPRKTIKNNLLDGGYSGFDVSSILEMSGYDDKTRAHQINIDGIVQLAIFFSQKDFVQK